MKYKKKLENLKAAKHGGTGRTRSSRMLQPDPEALSNG